MRIYNPQRTSNCYVNTKFSTVLQSRYYVRYGAYFKVGITYGTVPNFKVGITYGTMYSVRTVYSVRCTYTVQYWHEVVPFRNTETNHVTRRHALRVPLRSPLLPGLREANRALQLSRRYQRSKRKKGAVHGKVLFIGPIASILKN